ncbi:MAG: galactose mutarotase [Oscillospiraceae bacterium]|nr:galactose mutarotase [Oscillospiraceae bacterium]
MTFTTAPFGKLADGTPVTQYILSNDRGMTLKALDYGCVVQSLIVPDQNGNPVDVVLGYDDPTCYANGGCFFGAFVGRYANRIGGARFQVNGTPVVLTPNEGENHLHGAYPFRMFAVERQSDSLIFRGTSLPEEEGYPGKVELVITYTLTENNGFVLDYQATTDEDTVINLTNHSYFNLAGHKAGSAQAHILQIAASQVTEVGAGSIPTGQHFDVTGTPFDFRTAKPIGRDIDMTFPQLAATGGYDHNFVLDAPSLERPFASAYCPETGIVMDCYTTQPGVQFYNANFVQDDPCKGQGKDGADYGFRCSFCLETQHFPDSPNKPQFPTTLLRAGERLHEVTEYRFSVKAIPHNRDVRIAQ